MPRIFAPGDITTTQRLTNFTNGAAAIAADNAAGIAYFEALSGDGVVVDYRKHYLTELDKLPRDAVAGFAAYLGVPVAANATKAAIIEDIETKISTTYLDVLTVSSAAHGTEAGWTTVTITGAAGAGNAYYYKTAKGTAIAPLYGDQVDESWTATGGLVFHFNPGAEQNKVTVAEASTDSGFIIKAGNDTITVKGG